MDKLVLGDIMNKSNEYFNQRVACHVKNCKFQNEEEERCTLGEIIVDGEKEKQDTFCDSFESN